MDSIGVIGLVAGLWFALSPVEDRRPTTSWLGWVLAGASTVLLLAGTLTEPLTPDVGNTVTTDWTSDPTPDSPGSSGVGSGGSSDRQSGTPGASGTA